MNSITEGKGRDVPPTGATGTIQRVPTTAEADLRTEIAQAFQLKQAGDGQESRARSSIESRTDLRLAATNEAMRADPVRDAGAKLVDQETARRWADLDASDFGRIRSDARRENALESIAGHAAASPEYREELRKRSPALAEAASELNAAKVKEETTREQQFAAEQRSGNLAAAMKTREALLDATSLANVANVRAQQTAAVVSRLAASPETSTEQIQAARNSLKAPPLDGRVTAPNDPDIAAQAKRAIKRPIADEELSRALLARFVVSHEKRGLLNKGNTEFTYRDGQYQGSVAFVDAGKTLTTTLQDQNTIRAMVEVARAKNWNEVTLSGTDEFKRAAWLEARLNGLEVRGYEARAADQQMLQDRLQESRPTNSMAVSSRERDDAAAPQRAPARTRKHVDLDGQALTPQEATVIEGSRAFLNKQNMGPSFTDAALKELESKLRGERVYSGELVEKGRAPYKFEPDKDTSYYAVLRNKSGAEQVVWGKGLENALQQRSNGEQIVLQNIGKKDVIVSEVVRDTEGRAFDRPKAAQLNEWKATLASDMPDKARLAGLRTDSTLQPSLNVYDAKAPRAPAVRQRPERTPALQRNPETPSPKGSSRSGPER